ncbi:MAG: DUF4363 family protein [Lawsonibacter sp.]|jgi:hypothetical protein|nr:DUF4363 family protein [Lawsonibacter sp.]MCI9566430.1 DUF4363 family protein [Lawsonibacter sp.]
MKRLWIAAGLLVLLLGASLVNGWYAQKITGEIREGLLQAQSLAEQEDWTRAEALTRQAYEDWQSSRSYFHITMRHSDTDQVLRGFRQVLEYLQLREPDQYNAANADLMTQLELLAEMEQAAVANVL